eukprot:233843_1
MDIPQIVPHSDASVWSNNAFAFVAIINHSYMVYIISKIKKTDTEQTNAQKEVYLSLLFTIISSICWAFWNMLLDFDIFHNVSCSILYTIVGIFYYAGKFGIWNYSLIRLKHVFEILPNVSYKRSFIFTFQIVCVLSAVIGTVLISVFSDTTRDFYAPNKAVCNFVVHLWVFPIVGLLDGGISIFIYYLFHRKMKLLTNNLSQMVHTNAEKQKTNCVYGMNVDKSTYDLVYVTRKYAVLLAASLLSTWFTLIFISAMPNVNIVFASIDSIANMWCLLLFASKYDKMYNTLFKCVAVNETMMQFKEQEQVYNQSAVQSPDNEQETTTKASSNGSSKGSPNAVQPSIQTNDEVTEKTEDGIEKTIYQLQNDI